MLQEREKKSVKKIAAGSYFTALLDDMSNIYTFGQGDMGQLGHNNRRSAAQPRQIESLALYLAATESSSTSVGGNGGVASSGSKAIPKAGSFVGIAHISQKIMVCLLFFWTTY